MVNPGLISDIRRRVVGGVLVAVVGALALLGGMAKCQTPTEALTLGGGPEGGTFQHLAKGIADLAGWDMPEVPIQAYPSGGSVANLFAVNAGKRDLGLVFAGDAYLGRVGRLRAGASPTKNVRAVARLYGASSQLLVYRFSPIRTPFDLRGRRVAVGSFSSGATASARRYFKQLGIWHQLIPIYVGYAEGVEELKRGEVEAVWFEGGFPNRSLLEASREIPTRFIDLFRPAMQSGFFKSYPFYTVSRIPAGTYMGQNQDVLTFQDGALLVANVHVNGKVIYRLLQSLFSPKGLSYLRDRLRIVEDTEEKKALVGVMIPLHPGALKFWEERGVPLPQGVDEK